MTHTKDPVIPKRRILSTEVPESLLAELDAYCAEHEHNRSQAVRLGLALLFAQAKQKKGARHE